MHELEDCDDVSVKRFATGHPIFSTPIIDANERVYIGSADKIFYAIDPLQNAVAWQVKTGGVIDSAACIDHEGSVYIPSGDASLHKVSVTGDTKWKLDLLEQKYSRSSSIFWWEGNATLGPNGFIYAGNDDFYLYAIDPDGWIRWSFPTGLQIWSAPAFHNGIIYVASFDMSVYALDQETGRLKWKRRLPNVITASPAIDEDGNIYIGTFDGALYSLDGRTGKIRWKVQTGGSIYASAAIARDDMLYIGSGDGHMYAIATQTGAIQWTLDTGSPIWSSAVIGVDPEEKSAYLGYVGTSAGPIIAFDSSGKYRWAYQSWDTHHHRKAGVNASFALGKRGLATGTTAGDILYIPYRAYLQKNLDAHEWVVASSNASLTAIADLPAHSIPSTHFFSHHPIKEKLRFRIENMACHAPAIINPLDQVGIASLAIDVVIVRQDPESDRCVAWGVQSFGFGETEHTDGTLYPRRHFYAFSGEKNADTFSLEVRNCDFDITAFPMLLDKLSFTFPVHAESSNAHSFAAQLDCRLLFFKLLKKYGVHIVSYLTKQSFFSTISNGTQIYSAQRTFFALLTMLRKRVWNAWNLLRDRRYFEAEGNFSVVHYDRETHHLRLTETTFHARKRRITALFTKDIEDGHNEHPGILLIHTKDTRAVPLDYGRQLRIMRSGKNVIATLTIPDDIDLSEKIEAVVLVNTDLLATMTVGGE